MFLLNSEVCFEVPHLRTIASRCCRSCQVSSHVSSTVQAEPKHPPNRTALHNYFLGQTLEKSHRLRMPATANVEGSPGNTKKRQSFHRSAPPRPVQDSIRYCLALAQSLEIRLKDSFIFAGQRRQMTYQQQILTAQTTLRAASRTARAHMEESLLPANQPAQEQLGNQKQSFERGKASAM